MPRQINLQIRISEEERDIFKSVARLHGKTVADYIRDHFLEVYEQTDWYEAGHTAGQGGLFAPPVGLPSDKPWADYKEGWDDGWADEHGEDFVEEETQA